MEQVHQDADAVEPGAEPAGAARVHADRTRYVQWHLRWRKRVVRAVLAIIILDLALCGASVAIGAYEALALRKQVTGLNSSQLVTTAPAARDRLRVAGVAFSLARLCWWPWQPLASTVSTIAPVRVVGTVEPLLDLAADGSAAGLHAIDGLQPALSAVRSGHHAPGDAGVRLLDGLQRGHEELRGALADLNRAMADWATLDTTVLPASLRGRLLPLAHDLPLASDALHVALAAPDLLGATRPRYYLLVPQNPWDLRATGGFVGTAALLEARHGRLALVDNQASVDVDRRRRGYVPPPLPLVLYPHTDNWFYRDANWSPDFPTSAALLRYFYWVGQYWIGQPRLPDGVIAFDSTLLGPLLHITGPVSATVPGTTTSVLLTEATGVQTLDYYVNSAGLKGKRGVVNKSFANEAYHDVFTRLRGLSASRLIDAARTLGTALREKHLLLWLPDPTIGPILARRGWNGAIDQTRSDYLYVVDTNVHYNKINKRVREGITYRAVVRPDRSLLSSVTITYTNAATPGNIPPPQNNTVYEDFIRVYVPLGSRLVSWSGLTQPWPATRAHDKEVFAGYLRLPSRQHAVVTFTYVVPPNALLDAPTYQLTIQKQPGTDAIPLSVELRAGAPRIRVGGYAAWSWQGERRTDVVLTATLAGGHARPVPLVYDAGAAPSIGPGAEVEPGVVLPATLPGNVKP